MCIYSCSPPTPVKSSTNPLALQACLEHVFKATQFVQNMIDVCNAQERAVNYGSNSTLSCR